MNGLAFVDIMALLIVFSNDVERNEAINATSAQLVSHLLRFYASDSVIAKADEEIQTFKHNSQTPTEFFEQLWYLTLWCGI